MNALNLSTFIIGTLLLSASAQSSEPVSCEEFNRQATCASAPASKEITEEELYQRLEVNGDLNRFFRNDVVPNGVAAEQKADFSKRLWAQLHAYQAKFYCEPQYEIYSIPKIYDQFAIDEFLGTKEKTISHFDREVAAKEYSRKNAELLKTKLTAFLENEQKLYTEGSLSYCAPSSHDNINKVVGILHEPCTIEISRMLPDNEYHVEKYIEEIKRSDSFKEGLKCLKGRREYLSHIAIVASSSALNNTSDEFCKKDFLGLSKARAEQARDYLLPIILEGKEKEVQIELNYAGKNKNGTSGPCPYAKKANGTEELIKGFLTDDSMKNELENGKYLVIRFEFNSSKMDVDHQPHVYDHTAPCSRVRLSCKH